MMAERTGTIEVSDTMQRGYRYTLSARTGDEFDPGFRPELTPKEMLRLGVFGGKYMTDTTAEFPADWFTGAKLSSAKRDPSLNCFRVNASQGGSIRTIRGGGFNGIAGTTSAGGYLARTSARSGAGRPCVVTLHKSATGVRSATSVAGVGSVRRCFIGLTTAARSETGRYHL